MVVNSYFCIYVLTVESLGGKHVLIDDLVRQSDFIILTSVLVPETKFCIDKDRLALMKSNAVIINVGRGRKYIFMKIALIRLYLNKLFVIWF